MREYIEWINSILVGVLYSIYGINIVSVLVLIIYKFNGKLVGTNTADCYMAI